MFATSQSGFNFFLQKTNLEKLSPKSQKVQLTLSLSSLSFFANIIYYDIDTS